jgi:chromosome segregation ATPase
MNLIRLSIVTVFIACLSFSAMAHTIDRASFTAEMETYTKEIDKLDRTVSKNDGGLRDPEKAIRASELDKKNTETAITKKKGDIQIEKDEIGSFNLDGVEDQAKRLERKKKKAEAEISRSQNQITKKRSDIEKLYAEIASLESEIKKGEEVVEGKSDEIVIMRDKIESNGLAAQQEILSELRGDLKKFESEDARVLKSLSKEKANVEKYKIELTTQRQTLQNAKGILTTEQQAIQALD